MNDVILAGLLGAMIGLVVGVWSSAHDRAVVEASLRWQVGYWRQQCTRAETDAAQAQADALMLLVAADFPQPLYDWAEEEA